MTKVHGDPFHHCDYNAMVEGINQNGVLSGLAVSQKGAGADMSVDVAAGSALVDEEKYTEAGITNVAIDASEAGKHRKDTIIYDTATSAPIAIKGSSVVVSGNAVPPSVTADDILLAVVYIGDAVATITDANIYDGRIFISAIKDNWSAAVDPATTDDTAHGYEVGSRWVNTTLDKEFVCVDATTSAAVWIETTTQLQDDFLEIIRQMHPNVSVLAAMDDATLSNITKQGYGIYVLMSAVAYNQTFDSYNDGALNGQDSWVYGDHANETSVGAAYKYGASGKGIFATTDVPPGSGNAYINSRRNINGRKSGTITFYLNNYTYGAGNKYGGVILQDSDGNNIFGVVLHPDVPGGTYKIQYINNAGNPTNLPTDTTFSENTWYKIDITFDCDTNKYTSIKVDDVEKGSNLDAVSSYSVSGISIYGYGARTSGTGAMRIYVDNISITAGSQETAGNVLTDAIAANAAVLSFFSHLKGKFSNGASTHALPVGVEIFGNGDAYAAALNGTTKFKIGVADPRIELYRIDDSVVAKSGAQENWTLDDNGSTGAFAAKTTSTHETILGEEIGCASVVMVEKSVNGAFTDTELLVEDDDYTVDYSTRTATKIILTASEAADIVISQSKLRITWIADVEDIEGTANTALKMKIYLNRTATTEASPEIQKIDLGTDKYAEMKYMCG